MPSTERPRCAECSNYADVVELRRHYCAGCYVKRYIRWYAPHRTQADDVASLTDAEPQPTRRICRDGKARG